jgi:hypothetical protein
MKETLNLSEHLKKKPKFIIDFCKAVLRIKFTEKPDYESLKDIFIQQQLRDSDGLGVELKYDWVLTKQRILDEKREEEYQKEQEILEEQRLK